MVLNGLVLKVLLSELDRAHGVSELLVGATSSTLFRMPHIVETIVIIVISRRRSSQPSRRSCIKLSTRLDLYRLKVLMLLLRSRLLLLFVRILRTLTLFGLHCLLLGLLLAWFGGR